MSDIPPRQSIFAAPIVPLLALVLTACGEGGNDMAGAPPSTGPQPIPTQPAEARRYPLPALRGTVMLVGCRQGECAWSRPVRLETVQASPRGELRRLIARNGHSRHRWDEEPPGAYSDGLAVRWEGSDEASYVFCSTERPAFAFPDEEGGLIVHYLDLFNLAGYELTSAKMYLRLCHDQVFEWENSEALHPLGYRPGTRSEQVEDSSPEAMTRF